MHLAVHLAVWCLAAPVPKGKPAAALKLQGDKLVTAAGGKEVQIHGINW
jgi:hypothetical protein